MENQAQDQRKEKRQVIDFFLDVTRVSDGQFLGHLVDLTYSGMRLVSKDEIPRSANYDVKITLPGEKEKKEIAFHAKCKWSKKEEEDYFNESGFEISGLSREHADQIIQVLNSQR